MSFSTRVKEEIGKHIGSGRHCQIAELLAQLEILQNQQEQSDSIKEIIAKFKDIQNLDRFTVETLVDYIEVGGNKNDRIIKIHWNF